MFLSSAKRVFYEMFKDVDWILISAVLVIAMAGLVSMNSFVSSSLFFERQIVWLSISTLVFLFSSTINWSFLKNTKVIVLLFGISVSLLFLLFAVVVF
jgi:cell division protein FtsW (lipid II flippase)